MTRRAERASGVFLRLYLCAVALFLPFFCGNPVSGTENASFPTDFLVWMFLGFTPAAPAFCGALLSGIGLLWALCVYPWRGGDRSLKYVLAWYGLVLAGCVGLAMTTETDYAVNWMLHFLGAGNFALSVWWAARWDERLVPRLIDAIGVGVLILCATGVYQRLGGQLSKLEELQQEHREQFGSEMSMMYIQKLQQLRISSFFSDPNLFAAHLLVTCPVAFLAVSRWFRSNFRARLAMMAVLGIVLLTTLAWTGSKGGMLCAAAGAAVCVWMSPRLQKCRLKWLLPLLAVLAAVALACKVCRNTDDVRLASASARIVYYETALKMIAMRPWTGVGLGEFYPWYMRMKPLGAEITRDPHCLLLSNQVQNGVAGGVAVLILAAFPLVVLVGRTRWRVSSGDDGQNGQEPSCWRISLVCGYLAWLLHSMIQFDELVAGTVYLVAAMPVLALCERTASSQDKPGAFKFGIPYRVLAVFPALVCVVCVSMRIPAEFRLSKAEEELLDLERSRAELAKTPIESDLRQVMVAANEKRYSEWKDTVLALSDDMADAVAPCMMLLDALRREVLARPALDAVDDALVQQMLSVAECVAARVPHRSTRWEQVAWAALASRRWEQASDALARGFEWGPGDGRLYMLKAILAARKPEYLPLVYEIPARVMESPGSGRMVVLQSADDTQKCSLERLFAEAAAAGYDTTVKIAAPEKSGK